MSRIHILVDGLPLPALDTQTVAAAMLSHGIDHFHLSPSGQPRAPLCGMGTCFECRLEIDGIPHTRACQTLCREGLQVVTR